MPNNKSYIPASFLSKYIDRFYLFEQSDVNDFELPPLLPGTGLELVFHLGQPFSIGQKVLPKAHSVCPRKMVLFDRTKKIAFMAVRFKSGAFRHFCPIPFSELNNDYYGIDTLWESKGKELLHELENTSEIEDKIKTIELFLEVAFNDYHNPKNDKWDTIIDEVYYHFKDNTIKTIAEKAHLSLRQFERGFKAQFGITAKEFQKIARFQAVTKNQLLSKSSNYLDTILELGYFDQSHFIKEFKSLTQKTPSQYFSDENFKQHFYHPSVNESK